MTSNYRNSVPISSILAIFSTLASAQAYTTIVNSTDGLCLADPGYSTSLYTQQLEWKCDGGSDNNFTISPSTSGSYTIKNEASGLCLDVLSWSTSAGGVIGQYTCDGDSNQSFDLNAVSSGVYTIKSLSSSLCLSTNGSTSNGAGVVQEKCGGSGQSFKVTVPGVTASPTPSPSASPTSLIPPGATEVSSIQEQSNWKYKYDPQTSGSAYGASNDGVASPSLDGQAREFLTTFSSNGGVLYSADFGNDTTSTHFVYDAQVYLVNPSANANIEMDLNQVMSNGNTVIFGVQCSGWDGTWDITSYNTATKSPKWNKSNLPCDPRTWTAKTWHHVQIASHRDSSGNVTYDWVSLDGSLKYFTNATVLSAFSLNWAKGALVMNFQIDGDGSGTSTTYTDQVKTYRW
jgi:hypothetical protein